MPSAAAFIQWSNYIGDGENPPLFSGGALTFSSRQKRLHAIGPGERLWLVSRSPDDQQYYFVAVLRVKDRCLNDPATGRARLFGRFSVVGDTSRSFELARRFPAEGLLRAIQFESGKPVKYGASLGQSLQAVRLLSPIDDAVLGAALTRLLQGDGQFLDLPFGLWTKCGRAFADYFAENWAQRREPLAFMLYDPPPVIGAGAPVFIHSDKTLRLLARFVCAGHVPGHKYTCEESERVESREWFWSEFRERTLKPPGKNEFDVFWQAQNGIRAYFLMDNVVQIESAPAFKEYGKALEWGYPTGVGYRYLTLSQSYLMLRHLQVGDRVLSHYMSALSTVPVGSPSSDACGLDASGAR